jgi:hypothetical protein
MHASASPLITSEDERTSDSEGVAWIIQSGFRLASEARQRLRIFGRFIRQEFQPHEAVQLDVLSLIDHTRPAARNFAGMR